ncbi:MAG: protein phosphatase 2C domain-containing protein [Bacteroidales bacterium]|nr:protein phosphatase 2C domain-containing protein [Candidatus Sodaliphilus limicaballi]
MGYFRTCIVTTIIVAMCFIYREKLIQLLNKLFELINVDLRLQHTKQNNDSLTKKEKEDASCLCEGEIDPPASSSDDKEAVPTESNEETRGKETVTPGETSPNEPSEKEKSDSLTEKEEDALDQCENEADSLTSSSDDKEEIPAESNEETREGETSGKETVTPKDTSPVRPAEEDKSVRASWGCDDESIFILGASVQGKSHISSDVPCQDFCSYQPLGNGWGIAIVSDGAGSATHSDMGSKIVVERAKEHFSNLINSKGWIAKGEFPNERSWRRSAFFALKNVYDDLKDYATVQKCEVKSLNATIIVVIHAPFGLLVTHIGDGRAGYKDEAGKWHAVMVPHKGEEANQTIFVTNELWGIRFFELSGVDVPESRIITGKITAFTLMSDGCEHTTWLINQINEDGKYYDPNTPYAPLVDGFIETLNDFRAENDNHSTNNGDIVTEWAENLKSGSMFACEIDDKTMVLAILK